MSKWQHTSASQIKTYRRCARKWYWQKILGKQDPPGPAAQLGSELHAELEAYAKGEAATVNPIVAPLLEYIPKPEDIPNADVERSFRYYHEDLAVPIVGFIDLVETEARRVTDYKTTSSFRYAKTAEELRGDEQAVIYGSIAAANLFQAVPVTFRHLYACTKGAPKAREVEVELSEDDLAKGLAGIIRTTNDMAKDAIKTDVKNVKPNISACGDYGGCPHRADCAALGEKSFGAISSLFRNTDKNKEKPTMNLIDRLKAAKATNPTKTPPAQAKPQTAVQAINPPDGAPEDEVPDPEPETVEQQPVSAVEVTEEVEESYNAEQAAREKLEAIVEALSPEALKKTLSSDNWKKFKKNELVALAETLFFMHAPDGTFDKKTAKGAKKAGLIEMVEQYAQAVFPSELPEVTEGVVEVDMETDTVSVHAIDATSTTAPDNVELSYEDSDPHVNALLSRIEELETENEALRVGDPAAMRALFIGCHPRRYGNGKNTEVFYLDRILAPIQEEVAQDAQLPHYALIQYNEGGKRVAAVLANAIRQGLELPSVLVADRRNPNTDAVLEVILPMYDHVIERIS